MKSKTTIVLGAVAVLVSAACWLFDFGSTAAPGFAIGCAVATAVNDLRAAFNR